MIAPDVHAGDPGWWASLRHGGLLVAPSRLAGFPDGRASALTQLQVDRLRTAVTNASTLNTETIGRLVGTVLTEVLGLDRGSWSRGEGMGEEWSHRLVTGELLRPRWLWRGVYDQALPIFLAELPGGDVGGRLGLGRSRRTIARVNEWLRLARRPVAVVTNGRQFRLVHAGPEYDAFCEWDTSLWFVQGGPSPQVTALKTLLGRQAIEAPGPGQPSPLVEAILASRKGQSELSVLLGERVRQAVEHLVLASHQSVTDATEPRGPVASGQGDRPAISLADAYIAATRIVMRCIVILFAEARGLLPRANTIYEESYGLQSLRDQLDRDAGGGGRGAERLHRSLSAWPRLVSLFRLVHAGSGHEALPVPEYGGKLFEPGDPASDDPVLRAVAAFEQKGNAPTDAVIHRVLTLLTRTRVQVRQGRGAATVEVPVDFSDLSSEYIGILYEGLLDYELRRAPADTAVVFLNVGDQPALPLRELEALDTATRKALLDRLGKAAKRDLGDGDADASGPDAGDLDDDPDDGDDPEDGDDGNPDDVVDGNAGDDPEVTGALVPEDGSGRLAPDERQRVSDAVTRWARETVRATLSRLQASDDAEVDRKARDLVRRTVLPGEYYLVRWGGTRKGSGTFYTRPQLAGPLVRRTLQPLAYEEAGTAGSDGTGLAKHTDWTPRTPEAILDLKVCDPGMGSGSFLVSALRFLVDALVASLHHHRRLTEHGGQTICRLADGQPVDHPSQQTLPVPLDHAEFDDRLRAALRRHIVERCIYGVDIDPLAVELGQMALWVETMDRSLPFGFLDHKVKCGNSLVGCWLDQVLDYPAMAWERDGGDGQYAKPAAAARLHRHTRDVPGPDGRVERVGDVWTAAIKARREVVKSDLAGLLGVATQLVLGQDVPEERTVLTAHNEARSVFEGMHSLPIHEVHARAEAYANLAGNAGYRAQRDACDRWCAVWFWPGDDLGHAPLPSTLHDPAPETVRITDRLRARLRFFHWELEFPDVFTGSRAGFDAVVGNPPWEVSKPNSREFFSNLDPLYRGYGKQEALDNQARQFAAPGGAEEAWLAYCADFKAMSNWVSHAASPFGDPAAEMSRLVIARGARNGRLHETWRDRRGTRPGYADREHPYRHQGSADLNLYKLFLEAAHALVRPGGQFGFVVPSGIYSDKGASDLRTLFLDRCRWEWVFGFENREKLFAIDSRFKFCTVVVRKGGETRAIRSAFMHRALADWERAEHHAVGYPRAQVRKYSPHSTALLEIRDKRDVAILDRMYARGVVLGDPAPDGPGITYTREFDMTNDSRLFPPRPQWESRRYAPDETGHWLRGDWRPAEAFGFDPATSRRHPGNGRWSVTDRPDGVVLSRDGGRAIRIDGIEDVALPLYEGRMTGQFDVTQKGWVSGKGRTAVWRDIAPADSSIEPQYLMGAREASPRITGHALKLAVMGIGSATNRRSVFASLLPRWPAGNSLGILGAPSDSAIIALASAMNAFAYDWALRLRLGGLNLNWFVLGETAIVDAVDGNRLAAALQYTSPGMAAAGRLAGPRLQAVTPHERLRLRAILDALVADSYGLSEDDFGWILRDCDHPADALRGNAFARTLDPKGFWRVDAAVHPELRHPVLAQVAFRDLRKRGADAFLAQNDGEGWMLPETIRLADHGLGHDDRAREAQPVAPALGPRFLPWQLRMGVDKTFEECLRYAGLVDRINPAADVSDHGDGPAPPRQLDLFAETASPRPDGNGKRPRAQGPRR